MRLAADFPATSRGDWRSAALAVLRRSGVESDSPEAALATLTYDGVTVAPLYDAADLPGEAGLPGLPPYVRGARASGQGWRVRQRHAVPDPEAVLADLENGVDSLWLVVGDDAIAVADLPRVLGGVYLDLVDIVLEAGARTQEAAEALFGLAAERGTPLTGNLGAAIGEGQSAAQVAALARRCADAFPGLRAVTIDATRHHDLGASDAEELGCSIADGIAHLRALTEAGLGIDQALGQIEFRYAATADQFATIAKLRAARLLWSRVAEACGATAAQRQHAVTSSAMMTARDPWVNMLRTTLACFAAGVGGADAVTVQPFDAVLGLPDGFARRIARNTQSLLLEEAGIGRVIDPAGGSWYVERRTADLAEQAWLWFQQIEAAGPDAERLITDQIAATRARRAADIAHRRLPITGVSEFPNLTERLPVRAPAPAGRPLIRYAEEFERFRDLADARPQRPAVFLATIGPVAAHTARASFAANLFQSGGLATPTAGPLTDPAEIAAAFTASGARVACLCSSDRLYGEHAEAVAAALKQAGAQRVWLAGKGEYPGIDATLYAGCDVLRVLRTTFDDLEVTA